MALIDEFLADIDAAWKPLGGEPLELRIIGSGALMLQLDYERVTKDADVLETQAVTKEIKAQLLALAGRNTDIFRRRRIYIDVVAHSLPFLPQTPVFHPIKGLKLTHFTVRALDVIDVVVSKIKRLNVNDQGDIKAMTDRGLIDHNRLVARVKAAVDCFSIDARAEDLPKYIANLNRVERDFLGVRASEIDLPDWMQK